MSEYRTPPTEETLDPQDWEKLRALGKQMLDDMIDNLRSVRERPVWQQIPEALADICREEDLWFHVDGAFGALVALSPELRHLVKGMERVDVHSGNRD